MGRDKFKTGLEDLGLQPETKDEDKVIISFVVPDGQFAKREIKLGIQVPADFETTPPGGIHISPRLIPLNPNSADHSKAVDSPFGAEWEYLSRPFLGRWPMKPTVKRYMEHVTDLLNTL